MTARRTLLVPALAAVALVLAACGGSSSSGSSATPSQTASASASAESTAPPAGGPIAIGAFNFGESKILASMYAAVLAKAGYEPTVQELTNREVVEPALEAGDVQVVPEYLGTFTEFLNQKVNGAGAAAVASGDLDATLAAAQDLAGPRGLTVLTPSAAADQNAFAVTTEFATANSLATLSDLAAWSKDNDVVLGGPPECVERPFCQPGLEGTYGMRIAEFVSLDAGGPLTKQALSQGKINLGLVFSSDGGVAALDLTVLEDDKKLQTVDNIVAVVNTDAASAELVAALDAVAAALTTEDLIALNKAVDIDRKDPQAVAEEWLTQQGLL